MNNESIAGVAGATLEAWQVVEVRSDGKYYPAAYGHPGPIASETVEMAQEVVSDGNFLRRL